MARAGPRKVARYGDRFKATAVMFLTPTHRLFWVKRRNTYGFRWSRPFASPLALTSQFEAVEDIVQSLDAESLRVLKECAKFDRFWRSGEGTVWASAAMDAAYRHLLALRLIRGTAAQEGEKYEYEWTYLGLQTLIRLGLRPQP